MLTRKEQQTKEKAEVFARERKVSQDPNIQRGNNQRQRREDGARKERKDRQDNKKGKRERETRDSHDRSRLWFARRADLL